MLSISLKLGIPSERKLSALRKSPTFEAFRLRLLPSGPATLDGLAASVGIKASATICARIVARPFEFPALTAWLYAQWYMGWVAVRGDVPGKLDDLRHLVESARCDAFVTDDGDLVKVAPKISPSRECWPWQRLQETLA